MKGQALWDIKTVKASWQKPIHELAFRENEQRILPREYQADHLRRFQKVLIVKDQLLGTTELTNIQKASKYMKKTRGWNIQFKRDEHSGIFLRPTVGRKTQKLTEEEVVFIEESMRRVVNLVWSELFGFLMTEPKYIPYVNAWIKTGPLPGQYGHYHFTHYDCDEYLESSKGLFRFPLYTAIVYLDISEEVEGGATWFPEIKQGVIPKTNRLAIFDASLAHAVLSATAPKKTAKRTVMVMNVWDYQTRDAQIELTNGILGYSKDRKEELQWIP
ncbi:MAG TPA: hypothetical protein EYP59_10375 [Thiotrichaceae bacterium]|nr:hypothetical protein [Thiotrichaceae bacterium]